MAATKISDIIVPEVFVPYVVERTAELTEFYLGGIISRDDGRLDELARRGGTIVKMPFFKDLTGADEILSDATPLTAGAITTGQDNARLHLRGRAWGVNDLAEALSGADPMKEIADLVAGYWARRQQATLISSLKGVIADNDANDSDDMIHDVAIEDGNNATSAALIGPDTVVAAATTMGDAAGGLTAIAMHSACYANLQKAEAIEYLRDAETNIDLPYYLGKRVIVDDGMPKATGGTSGFKYTSVLFGAGAIGYGEGMPPTPVETDRDSLLGEDLLITRRHFLLHPRGVAWQEASVAGEAPTNTEAEAAANWDRVYERKNIRLAFLVTNG